MTKLTMESMIKGSRYEASKSVKAMTQNGTVDDDGNVYVLLEQAYIDGPWNDAAYFARAVKIGDEIVDGECPVYIIRWEITNPDWENAEDESYNCNWDNAELIKNFGATVEVE